MRASRSPTRNSKPGPTSLHQASSPLPDGIFGSSSFAPEGRERSEREDVDGVDLTFSAGFLWRISRQWIAGGTFRQGAKLGLEFEDRSGPGDPTRPIGTPLLVASSEVKSPDVYGLGLAFKSPNEALTLSFEWDLVGYSSIVESIGPEIFESEDFELDDAHELHFGFEYVFLNWTPVLALRLGTWLDPWRKGDVSPPCSASAQSRMVEASTDRIPLPRLHLPAQLPQKRRFFFVQPDELLHLVAKEGEVGGSSHVAGAEAVPKIRRGRRPRPSLAGRRSSRDAPPHRGGRRRNPRGARPGSSAPWRSKKIGKYPRSGEDAVMCSICLRREVLPIRRVPRSHSQFRGPSRISAILAARP